MQPSGTLTFLFTDIEGSTRLWDQHADAMTAALERHDEILRRSIDEHGGVVFSTGGDGFAAAFPRSVDAVHAAIAAQVALSRESWPGSLDLHVRMGMHTGEAQERDGNYFGAPLNRAARLMGSAHGGQVVMSSATAGVLGPAPGLRLVDLGTHHLKGLVDAVHVFGVSAPDLPWLDRPLSSINRMTGTLPRPLSDFVGRISDIERKALELRKHPLLTLIGPGGVGKTRLATEIGWTMEGDFADGVWMVELATVSEPAAVVAAVEAALAVQPQPGLDPLGSLVEWLRGRHLLLILDNCEHVTAAARRVASEVILRCATVRILATSREPLGIAGERVHAVQPLRAESDGVELFCSRATAADSLFTVSDEDVVVIAAIARELDGIPLAIELAAARTRAMTPSDLLARLGDRFRLLRAASPIAPERHQTLRATVEWSYQLIDRRAQILFDRLSVFIGGFDLASAEAVCSDGTIAEFDVAALLASLVDKSMVTSERVGRAARYRILSTLRRYGEERLAMEADERRVRNRFLAHFVSLATETNAVRLGPNQQESDAIFEREWDNIRAGLQWACAEDDLESCDAIIAATGPFAVCRALREHGQWAHDVMDFNRPDRHPSALTFGWAAYWSHGNVEAESWAERGIGLAPHPDHEVTALCWRSLVNAHAAFGRRDQLTDARRHMQRAASESTDIYLCSVALEASVEDAFDRGDGDALASRVRAFSEFAQRVKAPSLLAGASCFVGRQTLWFGERPDPAGALAIYRAGLELARSVSDVHHECVLLPAVVFAAAEIRGPQTAVLCRDALARLYENRSWPFIWLSMAAMSTWMVAVGDIEGAALVYGHIDAHNPPWSGIDGRVSALAFLRDRPDAVELIALSAADTRDQLVLHILAHLSTVDR